MVSPIRATAALAGVGLVVLAWVLFAPRAIGGAASYAVLYGNSMEPGLHRGDLAVVREADRYEVGDVVAYHSVQLDRTVLHRIVARDGLRFVLKGDNNDFLDPDRPGKDQILGKLWLHAPALGHVFLWARQPVNAALVVSLIALLALGLGAEAGGRRAAPGARPAATTLAVAAGALAVSSVALGAAAFTQPATREVEDRGVYVQHGAFSYAAEARPGPVYADGRATTGEPVFLALARRVAFGFDYSLEARRRADVRGHAALVAELGDGTGWRRTFVLVPRRAFAGPRLELRGTLDLAAVRREVERLHRETGAFGDSYLLTIRPLLEVRGMVGGERLADSFAPGLELRLDTIRLLPAEAAVGEDNAFVRRKAGSGTRLEPASLDVGRLHVPVTAARTAALTLGLVAAAVLALVGVARLGRRDGGEPARIEASYRALLVPVAAGIAAGREVVHVGSIEALARLAGLHNRSILHRVAGGSHIYAVEDGSLAYVYECRAAPEPPPRPHRSWRSLLRPAHREWRW